MQYSKLLGSNESDIYLKKDVYGNITKITEFVNENYNGSHAYETNYEYDLKGNLTKRKNRGQTLIATDKATSLVGESPTLTMVHSVR